MDPMTTMFPTNTVLKLGRIQYFRVRNLDSSQMLLAKGHSQKSYLLPRLQAKLRAFVIGTSDLNSVANTRDHRFTEDEKEAKKPDAIHRRNRFTATYNGKV